MSSVICCVKRHMLCQASYAVTSVICCVKRHMLCQASYAVASFIAVTRAICCDKCHMLCQASYAVSSIICCVKHHMLCQAPYSVSEKSIIVASSVSQDKVFTTKQLVKSESDFTSCLFINTLNSALCPLC